MKTCLIYGLGNSQSNSSLNNAQGAYLVKYSVFFLFFFLLTKKKKDCTK